MNLRRLKAVTKKELLHIVRDWRSLVLALLMPLLMLLLFGYALTLDVDRIPTYVYDWDRTPESRELIQQFRGSRYFTIVDSVDDYRTIERGIDKNKVLMSIVVAKDYSRNVLAGKEASIQILLDGSDSNTAQIGLGYAQAIVEAYSAKLRGIRFHDRLGVAQPDLSGVRIAPIEQDLNAGFLSGEHVAGVVLGDDDAHQHFVLVDAALDGAVVVNRIDDGEISRAAELLDQFPALGRAVPIVHVGGDAVDVESEGVAEQEEHEQRH